MSTETTTPNPEPDDFEPMPGVLSNRDRWRERRLSHPKHVRDAAVARCRVASAAYARAEEALRLARAELVAAAYQANEVGIAERSIGHIYGEPRSNVRRMIEQARRVRG